MKTPHDRFSILDKRAFVLLSLDLEFKICAISFAGLHCLGYETQQQLLGQPLQALVPNDHWDKARLETAVERLKRDREPALLEFDLLHRNGQRLPMSWCLDSPADQDDPSSPLLLFGFDTTTLRHSQQAVALFQSVAENYSGSILITDAQSRILYANPAAQRIMGYSYEELFGQKSSQFRSGETPDTGYRQLTEAIKNREIWKGEFINRRKDGELYVESKTIAPINGPSGEVEYYFSIGEDISQRQEYEQKIERLLMYDQQTGLPNRTAFMRELAAAMESASLAGQGLAVLHVDFDDFKKTNTAFGNDASDQVLAETAVRIKEILRETDVAARIAGDEFAVLLGSRQTGVEADSLNIAARLLAAIRRPYTFTDHSISITASIGIASFPECGDSAQDLMTNAMSATLRAKRGGGNDLRQFETTMAEDENGRRELLQAIEHGEMVLHFQPQVSLFSGSIIGAEALIRWNHPVRGLVFPGEFIHIAEESNFIVVLGEWVINEACRQIRAWLDAGLPPVKVAVNLAARHFRKTSLPACVAQALAAWKLEPRFLEIEITEYALMQDIAATIRNLAQLKELGVRISLDDFGTGYSSMAYLSRFPIDVVKIDQSFISDITTNPANAAIAQATIAMSHKLGKLVLAEGLETLEQLTYLRRSECDEMQGYYFSKPVPADEMAAMLQQDRRASLALQSDQRVRDTILLVDDEASILSALKRTLRREGYTILTAENAAEGFALLAKHPVKLIISDQHINEMTGTQFLSQARIMYPETVRIVLSGFSEIATVTDAINKGAAYRFLTKPWNDEQLKDEIRGALRHWRELYARDGDNAQ
ncbi:MAG: EAL domain-containing protein [Burkholderiaceae bacterium]|nr:EAL domain-containing protein [Burkholderiaceae bacterium]